MDRDEVGRVNSDVSWAGWMLLSVWQANRGDVIAKKAS